MEKNIRLDEAEGQNSDLKDKVVENTQGTAKIELMKIEFSLRDICDNIKCNNIHIIRVPEAKERV